MTAGIHQPNFLPWLGYFYKIAQCEAFVFFDDVEYTKRSFIRRVKIHHPEDIYRDAYLIVSLRKHSDYAHLTDLQLHPGQRWRDKIAARLYHRYHRAPHYAQQVAPLVDRFLHSSLETTSFADYTVEIITTICTMLDLHPQWHKASDLKISRKGAEANIEILQAIGADHYVSGLGARKYQTDDQYRAESIEITYSDFPSHFRKLDIDPHFLNKSIVAYLACFPIEEIRSWLLHK